MSSPPESSFGEQADYPRIIGDDTLVMSWTNIGNSMSDDSDPNERLPNERLPPIFAKEESQPLDLDSQQDQDPLQSSISSLTSLESSPSTSSFTFSHIQTSPYSNPGTYKEAMSEVSEGITTRSIASTSGSEAMTDERGTISAAESSSDEDGYGEEEGDRTVSGTGDAMHHAYPGYVAGEQGNLIGREPLRRGHPVDRTGYEGRQSVPRGLRTTSSSNTSSTIRPFTSRAFPSISDFSSYIDGEQYTNTTASSSTNTLRQPVSAGHHAGMAGLGSLEVDKFAEDLVWPSWPIEGSGIEYTSSAELNSRGHGKQATSFASPNPKHDYGSPGHNFRADPVDAVRGRVDDVVFVESGRGGTSGLIRQNTELGRMEGGVMEGSFVDLGDRKNSSRDSSRFSGGSGELVNVEKEAGPVAARPAPSRTPSHLCQIDQKWLDGLTQSASIPLSSDYGSAHSPSPIKDHPHDAISGPTVPIPSPYDWIFALDGGEYDMALSMTLAGAGQVGPHDAEWPFSKETIEKYPLCGGTSDPTQAGDAAGSARRSGSSKLDQAKELALLALPLLVLGLWTTLSRDAPAGSALKGNNILRARTDTAMACDHVQGVSVPVPNVVPSPSKTPFTLVSRTAHSQPTVSYNARQHHTCSESRSRIPIGLDEGERKVNSLSIWKDWTPAIRHGGGSLPAWSARFGRRSRGSNASARGPQVGPPRGVLTSVLHNPSYSYGPGDMVRPWIMSGWPASRNLNFSLSPYIVAAPLAALVVYGDYAYKEVRALMIRLQAYMARAALAVSSTAPIVRLQLATARDAMTALQRDARHLWHGRDLAIRGILDDVIAFKQVLLRLAGKESNLFVRERYQRAVATLSHIYLRANLGRDREALAKGDRGASEALRDKIDGLVISLSAARLHLLDKAWKQAQIPDRSRVAFETARQTTKTAMHAARAEMHLAIQRLSLNVGEIAAAAEARRDCAQTYAIHVHDRFKSYIEVTVRDLHCESQKPSGHRQPEHGSYHGRERVSERLKRKKGSGWASKRSRAF